MIHLFFLNSFSLFLFVCLSSQIQSKPPKTQTTTTPPLLLYLKLNHQTTIGKIQETDTQYQSPRRNPHPNPPPPNPRNPYPKSITPKVKIHHAHGDGERENRKEK
ncbi:hypothetical protein ACJW31_09G170000 [Castanea mollissima]